MKTMNKAVAAVIAVSLAASCTACGPQLTNSPTQNVNSQNSSSKKSENTKDEHIVLKVMDYSDSTQARRKIFNQEFEKKHKNVSVEYTMVGGNQAKTTLVTSIKAGTAPDLFALVKGMQLETAVKEGWYQPINDYVPKNFFDTFIDGTFNEGITSLQGKIYTIPEASSCINTLIFYNKKIFKDSGLDPENPPKTWSEFLKANEKITKSGKGRYYGIIEGAKSTVRDECAIRSFASLAGGKCNGNASMMLENGKNVLNSKSMKDAMNLYVTLVKKGCFHPDSVNISPPEARALFAQNQAGFIVQGCWCIPSWKAENPNLNYGVMEMPIPDNGQKGCIPYGVAQPWMGIYKQSKHPKLAGEYLVDLFGEDYQGKIVSDGGFISAVKGVNEKYMSKDPLMKKYYDLSQKEGKISPDPLVGNSNCAKVYAEVKDVNPDLGQIVQGVIAGSITNPSKKLDVLSEKTQKEWNRAINTVKKSGVKISYSDFEFPNWNPMENYTAADYKKR